jgi:hypothetical protein
MEYAVIIGMSAPDGGSYLTSVTSHTEVANIVLSHVFYKNEDKGLEKVFRWGQRPGDEETISIAMLKSMKGKTRFETQISGKTKNNNNQLDAIFSLDEKKKSVDVLLYNFNHQSLDYLQVEPLVLSFITDFPVDSKLKFRSYSYGKEQNKFQKFLENEPKSGWILPGFDKKGSPSRILNEEGKIAWAKFKDLNQDIFTSWDKITTSPRVDGGKGSVISISTQLPSFAFQKFEFRLKKNKNI